MSLFFGILFSLLKFILLLLLFLLLFLIIVILFVVFVPIKYKASVTANNLLKNPKDVYAAASLNWFFKLIKVEYEYTGKSVIGIYLFGFKLRKKNKKPSGRKKINTDKKAKAEKRKKIKVDKKSKHNNKVAVDETANLKATKQMPSEKVSGESTVKTNEKQKSTDQQTEKLSNETKDKTNEKDEVSKQQISLSIPHEKTQSKTDNKVNKTKKTKVKKPKPNNKDKPDDKLNLMDRFVKLKEQIVYYYNYPDRDIIIKSAKKLIKRIIKAVIPNRVRLQGELGLSDLAITGQIIGVSSAIAGMSGKDIFLIGNFSDEILKIDGDVESKFRVWSVVLPVLQFAFTKPIFKLVISFLFSKK